MRGGEIILSTAAANDTELATPCRDEEGELPTKHSGLCDAVP